MHLHHSLSRELFELLKELAAGKQIIVATHSEYFAEISEVNKNWFLEKKGKEAKFREIETQEDLLKVLSSIGAEAADRGYPNKILFVAGETEKSVLPIWARILKVNIEKVRIEPLEGEYDQRKISIINNYIKEAQTTVFLMVDSHAGGKVKQAVDEEHRLVLEGSIEDCYPIPILVDVLNKTIGLDVAEGDINPEEPRVNEIKRLLKDKLGIHKTKTFWKIPVGIAVAKQMSKDAIPEEIRDFIVKVAG